MEGSCFLTLSVSWCSFLPIVPDEWWDRLRTDWHIPPRFYQYDVLMNLILLTSEIWYNLQATLDEAKKKPFIPLMMEQMGRPSSDNMNKIFDEHHFIRYNILLLMMLLTKAWSSAQMAELRRISLSVSTYMVQIVGVLPVWTCVSPHSHQGCMISHFSSHCRFLPHLHLDAELCAAPDLVKSHVLHMNWIYSCASTAQLHTTQIDCWVLGTQKSTGTGILAMAFPLLPRFYQEKGEETVDSTYWPELQFQELLMHLRLTTAPDKDIIPQGKNKAEPGMR